MVRWPILTATLGLFVLATGCGPNVDPEDLGTVIYELPEVSEKEPGVPEADETPKADPQSEGKPSAEPAAEGSASQDAPDASKTSPTDSPAEDAGEGEQDPFGSAAPAKTPDEPGGDGTPSGPPPPN